MGSRSRQGERYVDGSCCRNSGEKERKKRENNLRHMAFNRVLCNSSGSMRKKRKRNEKNNNNRKKNST